MSIQAKILLDSINPIGNRITTWVLKYPRFIHSEVMTHRVFSRNASSSRAIPVKKMLEDVQNDPAMPVYWGKNQSGMQANEELCDSYKQEFYTDANDKGWVRSIGYDTPRQLSKEYWLKARDSAVEYAKILNKIGLHKQIANRILEPWMHITVLLTGTEFENFFALRAHKDAQPEFQKLAYLMLDLYQQSEPKQLGRDEWHIPFGDKLDLDKVTELAIKSEANGFGVEEEMENAILNARLKISVARCARVSYLNFDGKDDYEADIALADRLASSGHWSPFEHCATPHLSGEIPIRCGNFLGWKQYRKFFPQENRRDGRVGDPRYLVKYS